MASLDYRRKKMIQIFAVAFLLALCCFVLTACNNDSGTYDVSQGVSNPTHFIAKLMVKLNDGIGNFGWTVIAFTVILKLVLSPLDVWQKHIARKNSKAMDKMKPQLEAMQEKFGNDKERYQQEQMALYKKEKYSMMGACLPTIVTLVVFVIIFAGFREMVGFKFASDYKNCYDVYTTAYNAEVGADYDTLTKEEQAVRATAAKDVAQTKVFNFYNEETQVNSRAFLWIKNVFVPDSWKTAVPDYLTVTGQSGFATSKMVGVLENEYNDVMGKVLGTGGWGKNGKWNGWLLLPVLS
ncbi:MAG: YidC/Oxa1 family membrane protein insertase, partial [Clostridia bacterium]